MGLLTFVGRVTLVVINIVFILVSLALILLGFLVRYATTVVYPFVEDTLGSIQNSSKALSSVELDLSKFDLGPMVSDLCTVVIILGVALLALAFVGCCGACCNFTTVMLVYAIVLIVILVAQVAVVIMALAANSLFIQYIETGMKKSTDDYQGLSGNTAGSLGWNWIMQEFQCCGAESYADFTDVYKTNDGANVLTPIACCKVLPSTSGGRDACAGNSGVSSDVSTLASVNNYNTGCAQAVWDWSIESPKLTYLLLGIGFAFAFQIVLIVFACLGYKNRGVSGGLV